MLFIFLILNLIFFQIDSSSYIFVNSVPKCGTYLTVKLLEIIYNYDSTLFLNPIDAIDQKNKNGKKHIYGSHLNYDRISELNLFFDYDKIKTILVIRDPRDFVVSLAYWMKKNPVDYIKWNVENKTINELISEIILSYNVIEEYYKAFYFDWVFNCNDFFVIKFEDLIGIKGEGSDSKQKEIIINLCKYLDIIPSDDLFEKVKNNLFGNSGSFREGKIGSWRKEFTYNQKIEFIKRYHWLFSTLDYAINP